MPWLCLFTLTVKAKRIDLKNLTITIFICFNLINLSAVSKVLDILVPNDRVSINQNKIIIIGKTDAQIVDFFLNGKLYDNILVVDSFFHKQIDFGYGLHEIKIIPVYSGKPDSNTVFPTVEVMYAPLIERKYKRLYPDYSFHSQEVSPICLKCHEVDFENFNEVDDSKTCMSCHISLRDTFNKHTKAENKTCFLCHELSSNLKAIVDEQTQSKNPCYKCHEDKMKSFKQEYVHGPIAGGSCLICHAHHGSEYEHILNLPEDRLCFECHEDVEKQVNATVVHKPFIEGKCGGCHDPHSTNNEWVLKASSEMICLSCHAIEGDLREHNHPFNVTPKKELQNNLELTSDGKLECLTCHNPHSSKQPYMLKTDKNIICLGCHLDLL